eukprot:UN07864
MSLEPLPEHKYDNGELDVVDNVIDWGVFTKSLSKIVGEGILCVMVLSSNGTLLSSFGVKSKSAKRIIPPLLTSIWKITSDVGKKFVDARGLELMFVNCKVGRIAISVIPDDQPYFICLLAQNEVELGLLKVKLELITDQLAKILFNEDDEDEDDIDNEQDIVPSTNMQSISNAENQSLGQ